MGVDSTLSRSSFSLLFVFISGQSDSFFLLHAADFLNLGLVEVLVVILLAFHDSEFFFLQHFHACLFEGLSADHTEKWLYVVVKNE